MSKANPVCPFCKGAISKDLERYGGNCPHCLLEVPGDDAPTDPGLELKKKQEEEEKIAADQRQRRSRMMMVAGMLSMVLVAGLGGWQYLSWKKSLEYDPQEYYQLPLEDLTIAQAEVEEPLDPTKIPVTTNGGTGNGSNGSNNGGNNGGNGSRKPVVGEVAVNNNPLEIHTNNGTAPVPPDRRVASSKPATGGGPDQAPALPTFGMTQTVELPSSAGASTNTSDVLSDRTEIEAMAAKVIKVYNRQILTCYEQAVKQIPDLKGIWTVSFTITPGGTTDSIRVKGAGISNPDMEACMQRSVTSWKFAKLTQEFKLAKQYRLSPSGW